jgi:GNAT superfamily N-acetyltransferase
VRAPAVIRDLDLFSASAADVAAAHVVASTCEFGHLPGDEPMPLEEWLAEQRKKAAFLEHRYAVARMGEETVGYGFVELERDDNPHLAWANLGVLPEHQRQGIGTQLLDHLTAIAEDDGRTSLGVTTDEGSAGERLLAGLGLTCRQTAHQNRLRMAEVDRDLLRSWVDRAPERAAGYELRVWDGPTPDDLVEAFAACTEVMNTAPLGDLEINDERMTPERLRIMETARAGAGVPWWTICAVHVETGALVGFSQLYFSGWRRATAKQGDTGVDPAHRNRGLGRWIKAAMLLRLLVERPEVSAVDTWNAGSNEPMLAINHALGFRRVRVSGNWQGDLDVVRKHLRERSVP